jgi:uncharacterized DUF497 family protein
VRFEWDDEKEASNLRKHGLDFSTAQLVFEDPWHVVSQDREVDGEQRWQTIGRASAVTILLVAHTVEDEDEELIRIISAREATPNERRVYESGFFKGSGQSAH